MLQMRHVTGCHIRHPSQALHEPESRTVGTDRCGNPWYAIACHQHSIHDWLAYVERLNVSRDRIPSKHCYTKYDTENPVTWQMITIT